MSEAPPEPPKQRLPVRFGFHLVLYIDLLGQANALNDLRRMPETPEEQAITTAAINSSAGKVLQLRLDFQTFVSAFNQVNPTTLAQVPAELHESFLRFRLLPFTQIGFSDTFVHSVPMIENESTEEVGRAALAIWTTLMGAAGITIAAFARGIPIRGGADVGPAIANVFPNEVYGPALVDAYRLESQVAEYPRIAIGRSLLGYLDYIESRPIPQPFKQHATKNLESIRKLITPAPDDGWPMLHFLSPEVTETMPKFAELRPRARQWVTDQVQAFAKNGDEKLYRRYRRLATYFAAYPDGA